MSLPDLPLSSEIMALLRFTLDDIDNHGVLRDTVGSHLTQPLSVESLFFPSSAIITSKFSASKPKLPIESKSFDMNSSSNTVSELSSRLRVLWLQRKARLEEEDGLPEAALDSFQTAISEHIGNNPLDKSHLLSPAMNTSSIDILHTLERDFLLYEPRAHRHADIIQRWYRHHLFRKAKLVTMLTKCVRGYLVRAQINRKRKLRSQCSILIQRRFRTHLLRMHKLSTLIKQWYSTRKAVRDFKRRLHLYTMTRRIQKVFRGMLARNQVQHKILKFSSVQLIQREARCLLERSNRFFVISRLHKKFFQSARRIQRWIRRIQAIERCRIRLLLELLRENLRCNKETVVVNELLRVERRKFESYLHTKFGKLQLHWHSHELQCREDMMRFNAESQKNMEAPDETGFEKSRNTRDSSKKIMSEKQLSNISKKKKKKISTKLDEVEKSVETAATSEIAEVIVRRSHLPVRESFVSPQVIAIIEMFDEFDDGRVPISHLPELLNRLHISTNEHLLEQLRYLLDSHDSGFFSLSEFLRWFDSKEADEFVWTDHAPWNVRHADFFALKSTHSKKQKKLRNEILTKHFATYYVKCFRSRFPPKFQCCQCLEAFPLFSDYFFHFEKSNGVGNCPVKKLPALFFPKYWFYGDSWLKQRELENEICRVNDEFAFVRYWSRFHCFEEIESWSDKCAFSSMESMRARLNTHFSSDLKESTPPELLIRAVDLLMDHLFPISSVNTINDFIIRIVAKLFKLPVKKQWIVDNCLSREETRSWLFKELPLSHDSVFETRNVEAAKKIGKSKKNKDSGITDLGSNKNAFRKTKRKFPSPMSHGTFRRSDEVIKEYSEGYNFFYTSPVSFPIFNKEDFSKFIDKLSAAVLCILRLRMLDAQYSILALIEYRSSRPRTISLLTDDEIAALSLFSITQERYHEDFEYHVRVQDACMARYACYRNIELESPRSWIEYLSSFFSKKKTLAVSASKTDFFQGLPQELAMVESFVEDDRQFSAAKTRILLSGSFGSRETSQLAQEFVAVHAVDWCETSDIQKLSNNMNTSDPWKGWLLKSLARVFMKYAFFANKISSSSLDPISVESWSFDIIDLHLVLDRDFREYFSKKELHRLKELLIVNNMNVSSLPLIRDAALQLLTHDHDMIPFIVECKHAINRILFFLLREKAFMQDVRDVQLFSSATARQHEIDVIASLPRRNGIRAVTWEDIAGLISSSISLRSPKQSVFLERVEDNDFVRSFSNVQNNKMMRDLLSHSEISSKLQLEAERKSSFLSRFSRRGRKAVRLDSQLVDISGDYANALLCVVFTPSLSELTLTGMSTFSKYVAANSHSNRYFHRILLTVCEIPAILLDTTCTGALDDWEKQKVEQLFSARRNISPNQTSATIKAEEAEQMPLHSFRSAFEKCFPKSVSTHSIDTISVDVLRSRDWIISEQSIVWRRPSNFGVARVMIVGAQRRVSHQLIDEALKLRSELNGMCENTISNLAVPSCTLSSEPLMSQKDHSLIVRCQLLATRQVRLFLKKRIGKAHVAQVVWREVEDLWNRELLSNFPALFMLWKKFTEVYGFDVNDNNYGLPKTAAILRDTIGVSTKSYSRKLTTSTQRIIQTDYVSFLRYSFSLHCEPQQFQHAERPMMLSSELCHVVKFIRERFPTWRICPDASYRVIRIVRKATMRDGVVWLDWNDFFGLVGDLFDSPSILNQSLAEKSTLPENSSSVFPSISVLLDFKVLKLDSERRIYSRARQQALLIALSLHDVTVPETNYRCLVLGWYEVSRHINLSEQTTTTSPEHIPRELVPIFMQSQAFDFRDLFIFSYDYGAKKVEAQLSELLDDPTTSTGDPRELRKIQSLCESFGNDSLKPILSQTAQIGRLDDVVLATSQVSDLLRKNIWKDLTMTETLKRYCMMGFCGHAANLERLRLQYSLETKMKEIESQGAVFLREILTGISHCAFI